jgi:hypothetical protein
MTRSLKSGLLVALVLMSAVVVIASPAFATPNLTDSSGTRPVAPFITPIGNTTDSSVAATEDGTSRFTAFSTLLGSNIVVSCASTAQGHVLATHTRAVIDTLRFDSCRTSVGGTVVVRTNADSTRCPFFLHVARRNAGATSWDGTFNIPTCGSITIEITGLPLGASCGISLTVPQSIRGTDTDVVATRATSLSIFDTTVQFRRTAGTVGCVDDRRTATQQGLYTLAAVTTRDPLRSTAGS